MERREPQKRLESRHRGPAAVESERELFEVALEVLVADAVMGATEPRLEIAKDAVHPGQELPSPGRVPLSAGAMPVPQIAERERRRPPICADDRAPLDVGGHEPGQRPARGVRDDLQADRAEARPRTSTAATTKALWISSRPPRSPTSGPPM